MALLAKGSQNPWFCPQNLQGFPQMMGTWQWDHQDYVSLLGEGKCSKKGAKTPTFVLKIHTEDGG